MAKKIRRLRWALISPSEAAKRIRKSRGMSKRDFNRLWKIAWKGGIRSL